MMPRKSGIEALRELRAEGVETPALIVSAHQDAGDAGSPTELEVSGYVTKPIDFDRLFSSIAELTDVVGGVGGASSGPARLRRLQVSGEAHPTPLTQAAQLVQLKSRSAR